jgi:hypothetical protein
MPKEEQQSNKRLKSTTVRIQAHADATANAAIRPRLVPDIEELKKSVSVDEIRKQGFKKNSPRTIEIVKSFRFIFL